MTPRRRPTDRTRARSRRSTSTCLARKKRWLHQAPVRLADVQRQLLGKPSLDVKLAGRLLHSRPLLRSDTAGISGVARRGRPRHRCRTDSDQHRHIAEPAPQEVGVFRDAPQLPPVLLELPCLSGGPRRLVRLRDEGPLRSPSSCFGGGGCVALELGFKALRGAGPVRLRRGAAA